MDRRNGGERRKLHALRHAIDLQQQKQAVSSDQQRELRVLLQQLQKPLQRDELFAVELKLEGIVPFDATVELLYNEARKELDHQLTLTA